MSYWQDRPTIISGNSIAEFERPQQLEIRNAVEDFIIKNNINDIIEFGCNTGILSYRLHKKGYTGSYVGCDSNTKAVVRAMELNQNGKSFFSVNDIERMNFHNLRSVPKYEMVYSKDVIEHLEYYSEALNNLIFITKRYLVLSFFIKPSNIEKIVKHKDGYYLNQYDRNKLISFVNHFGFKNKTIFENQTEELIVFEKLN